MKIKHVEMEYRCDLCGKKVEGFSDVGERTKFDHIIDSIRFRYWYAADRFMLHFCDECQVAIMDFLDSRRPEDMKGKALGYTKDDFDEAEDGKKHSKLS